MTILLTPFMSCSAKIPIYGVFSAAFFPRYAALVMISLYFGGILVGVLVFEALKICLQFLGVDPAYTFVAQGLVIIIAVALDLRKYLAKK